MTKKRNIRLESGDLLEEGDWVFCPRRFCDLREERYIPCFQVKEISSKGYLRPEKGIPTGVNYKFCRKATDEEIYGGYQRSLVPRLSELPESLLTDIEKASLSYLKQPFFDVNIAETSQRGYKKFSPKRKLYLDSKIPEIRISYNKIFWIKKPELLSRKREVPEIIIRSKSTYREKKILLTKEEKIVRTKIDLSLKTKNHE